MKNKNNRTVSKQITLVQEIANRYNCTAEVEIIRTKGSTRTEENVVVDKDHPRYADLLQLRNEGHRVSLPLKRVTETVKTGVRTAGYKVVLKDNKSGTPMHVRVLKYRQPDQITSWSNKWNTYHTPGMNELIQLEEEMKMIQQIYVS